MFVNPFVFLAFFLASFIAAYRVQWQSFFYLFVTVYAVQDVNQFLLCTFIYLAASWFSQLHSAVK